MSGSRKNNNAYYYKLLQSENAVDEEELTFTATEVINICTENDILYRLLNL